MTATCACGERRDAVDGVRAAQIRGHAVVDDLRAREDARDAEAVVRPGRRGGHHRAVRMRHAGRRPGEVLRRGPRGPGGCRRRRCPGRRSARSAEAARASARRWSRGPSRTASRRRPTTCGRRRRARPRAAGRRGAGRRASERARSRATTYVPPDLQRAGAVAPGDRGAAGGRTDDPGRRARGRAVHVAGEPDARVRGPRQRAPRPGRPSRARRRARRRPPPSPSRSRAGAYAPRAPRDQRYAPVKFTVRFWTLPASSTISSRTR